MKIKSLLTILIFCTTISFAQKALPIQVGSLLAKIPELESCAASFKLATIDSNEEGILSVKDAGPIVNGIQDQMTKDMTDLASSSMSSSSYTNTSMPSQDQINQALQNASKMQGMSREQMMQMAQHRQTQSPPPGNNSAASFKEFGKAQDAAGKLSVLQGQLATEASQLGGEYRRKLHAISTVTVTCQEYKVQGADLALPKCGCVKALYMAYYQKRVTMEDEYLQKLNQIVHKYLPVFKEQIAIIDKVEGGLKYGDAVSLPVIKTHLVGVQQQAIGSLTTILGVVSNAIKDSATEFADLSNINNGHLPTPCQ
ncbi:MAG TPA: hypothetical protein VLS85_02475 [Hanamia sp.]|nr:hypothetical protein [Hanamia sp.]